ncbi:MAG: hypothetical protein OXR07_09190, partial [Nitrospira sp.]|nr:hypothetical protein [Nitrospira sp.]
PGRGEGEAKDWIPVCTGMTGWWVGMTGGGVGTRPLRSPLGGVPSRAGERGKPKTGFPFARE